MSSKWPIPQLLKTAYRADQLAEIKGPAVIFLGRSNAGKSSLINALTRTDLAKVSKTPGKTRSINYFKYGPHLLLVDLPGFGYARRSKEERKEWADLIRAFFDHAPPRLMGFLLVDCHRELDREEGDLLFAFHERSYPLEILLTKADRLKQAERNKKEKYIRHFVQKQGWENLLTYRFVSVKNGEGLDSLQRAIYQYEKNFF